jgi:hypothetical protein
MHNVIIITINNKNKNFNKFLFYKNIIMSNNSGNCNNQGEQYVFTYANIDSVFTIKESCDDGKKHENKSCKSCNNSCKKDSPCKGDRCRSETSPITLSRNFKNNVFKLTKDGELTIYTLNIYNITFTTYANVCPYSPQQHLPINVEYDENTQGLEISVTTTANSVNIYGVIPAGMVFQLSTNCRLLRYFQCAQVVGKIGSSDAADTLKAAQDYTIARKIRYIPAFSSLLSVIPPIPFPPLPPLPGSNWQLQDQYPVIAGPNPWSAATFPWDVAVIPWFKNQPIPLDPGFVPNPIIDPSSLPPVLPSPLINGIHDNYRKFRSIGDTILYYIGLNGATLNPLDPRVSVFVTNFEDRGQSGPLTDEKWQRDNYKHKTYMAALSVDKMQFYLEKMNAFINTAFDDAVTYQQPLISSFQKNLILFFLRMHVGEDDFPDYVIKYFSDFVDFIGRNIISPNPNDPDFIKCNQQLFFGNMTAPCIFEYFRVKNIEVQAREDKSTLFYWWAQAGLNSESITTECVHNIIAFSQFTNIMFQNAYITTPGKNVNPISPLLPNYVNFFEEYKNAITGEDKLNVVREMFRILVPNSSSFSNVDPLVPDPDGNEIQSRHLHQPIMISNVPIPNPLPPPFNVLPNGAQVYQAYVYFTYNPGQYPGNANLDNLNSYPVVNDFTQTLQTTYKDQETVLDMTSATTEAIIPIFPKPDYTPFGLGYRRCPGEIFVYTLTEILLAKFGQVKFKIVPGVFPDVAIAPFKLVPDNIFVDLS